MRIWPADSSISKDERVIRDAPEEGEDSMEIELALCMDYCTRLYLACKDAIVLPTEQKVRHRYPIAASFCRHHFGPLFDIRLQTESGLCYPVSPGFILLVFIPGPDVGFSHMQTL
jgi:hypothetical protein